MSQLFSIKDKVILITGSSRGIGFELARIMGGEGARVILNGKDATKLDAAVSELKERGVPAYAAAFDVTDTAGVERAVEDIHSRIGPVDVLVNNAGVQIRSPLEDFAKSDLEKILSVNLEGAFTVSQVVGRYMIRRQKGKIINICSVQSELGRPSIVPYAMSKGGLKMMTKGMAAEWGKHNIQVNGLGPGYFKTDLTKPLVEDDAFSSWLYTRVPAGRWGEPAELAGAAIFLASSASDYVNGHILYVDGGMLASV
jgi:gluconate 5-dehydrogenase